MNMINKMTRCQRKWSKSLSNYDNSISES